MLLETHPIDANPRKLKVAVIGAGFSGICAGIRLQGLKNAVEFDIFEKDKSVGGTWMANRYPNLACDIPAHCYAYTFEPNPNWSHFYAYGPEILAYLQNISLKYKLDRFIRYHHELVHSAWDEATSKWTLKFNVLDESGNKVDEKIALADVVIQSVGGLSRWDWPDIPGLEKFQGTKIHSAAYEGEAKDSQGKVVAVIGSGSSAIQIVPALQPFAKRLDTFVRGQTWIAAPFASTELMKRQPDGRNHKFSEEEKAFFASNPEAYHSFRHGMESELNSVHTVTMKRSPMQLGAVKAFRGVMLEKLAKKPEIAKCLIPTFPVACRRLTPGPGYLEALVEDNVDFISTGIKRMTETGIETVDGVHREYDMIVLATGFDCSYRPRIPIIGRNNRNLQDEWANRPTSYLSIAPGPSFPNYFCVNGPNSALGSGSLLVLFEREVDYILAAISKMQRENIAAMAAKQSSVDDFMDYVDTYFETTVYSEKCRSWYKAGQEEGKIYGLWPGSCLHAIAALKSPRWEDFEYTLLPGQGRTSLSWLGVGCAETETQEKSDKAPYLKGIDFPAVPE